MENKSETKVERTTFAMRILRSGSLALGLIVLGWALGFC
ncbi:MAG: hypothetical protein ACI87E_003088 [Mariniblastus sp.]|jgi:hypothetical protein